jgi:hypothetical protein
MKVYNIKVHNIYNEGDGEDAIVQNRRHEIHFKNGTVLHLEGEQRFPPFFGSDHIINFVAHATRHANARCNAHASLTMCFVEIDKRRPTL